MCSRSRAERVPTSLTHHRRAEVMSALGQKRTFSKGLVDVRFVPYADIPPHPISLLALSAGFVQFVPRLARPGGRSRASERGRRSARAYFPCAQMRVSVDAFHRKRKRKCRDSLSIAERRTGGMPCRQKRRSNRLRLS
jgi:hypothetical protein